MSAETHRLQVTHCASFDENGAGVDVQTETVTVSGFDESAAIDVAAYCIEALRGRRVTSVFVLRRVLATIAMLLAFAGCAVDAPSMPVVRLTPPLFEPRQEIEPADVDGARAWEAIGFTVTTEASNLPRCARRWYDAGGERNCELPIIIERSPIVLPEFGTQALANRGERHVLIDSSVTDYYALLVIAAHEVGHIALDTAEHTRGGVMGGAAWTLKDVDYELACSSIGVCR